ncbi:hypothetical protein KC318_g9435 [Hortaea werneckii]|nr:hypothetical protein KC334_g2093 [Hortaea werneckii]KAI7002300.1 hypothetical protein KC355_g9905 [Hortaea werneckii]KAI7661482.1 hypothetical protein KC318_g9435 [Hortaea werneckii]RMX93034.1 hypothetical protein D0867_14354 [Hortaea werneckii]
MDRLNSPAYGPAQQSPHNQATSEGRQSLDSQRLRLRKKRSYNTAGVRNASQPLPATAWPQNTNIREPGDNERARRGALRNVVRRIFGRRSKEFDSHPPVRASPPRHGYHRSEPPALSTPKNANHHGPEQDSSIPHRTLSAPVHHLIPPPNLDRQRSPYAVEFPHSARLKPLNLANPFTAPGSQLRRRKTLPSLFIPPDNNETPPQTADDAQGSPDRNRSAHLGSEQDTVSSGRHAGHPNGTPLRRNSKRKSRSVGDLKFFQRGSEQTSPRKRNEDLRIWRDSLHGYNDDYVLRASGFTSAMLPPPVGEVDGRQSGEVCEDDETKSRLASVTDPFQTRASFGRAKTTMGDGDTGFLQQQPTYRTGELAREDRTTAEEEISHDLEDRVARLEAGLQHFQLSLQRMTTTDDRSRSSSGPVVGSGARQSRTTPSSSHPHRRQRDGGVQGVDYARTPSMLADTLAADFISSSHHHHHHQNGSSAGYDVDDPLHRLPSSSPLQYYYRQPSSVHEPHRPETPQTPPALQDSGLSPHYYGNLPGARPSMPPLPRTDSTTMTREGDDEDEVEENFPFPAQAASFSLGGRERTEDLPSGMATAAIPVDSPSEPPHSGGPWTSRKRRKESGGFHFPFSSSLRQEQEEEEEEEGQEMVKERQLRQEQDEEQEQDLEQRPPEYPAPQQRHQQQQQQHQHQYHHQQQHTFKSLYEMLSDERSARRNLEVQLRGLRREIRDLHLQVSTSSSSVLDASADLSPPASRSQMAGDPLMMMATRGRSGDGGGEGSSGRFRDSFSSQQRHRPGFASDGPGRGREGGGPQPQGAGDSGINPASLSEPSSQHAVGSHGGGVISRFSGSESEAGVGAETRTGKYEEQQGEETDDEDELMTPLEAYQTPREEASRFGLREGVGAF